MSYDSQILSELVRDSIFWKPADFRPSSWLGHTPFAFWIVDALRPRSVVELGSWHGMSYLAFCQAMTAFGVEGRATAVDTWQGDHQAGWLGESAYRGLKAVHDPKYGHFSTLVRATFDEALATQPDGSIDLLHIDGLHTYEAVKHDFETWLPKMSERGVILFHDTQERHDDFGVYRLWAEVAARYPHFEFRHEHGLGVIAVGSEIPPMLARLFAASADPRERDAVQALFERPGDGVRGVQVEIELLQKLNRYRDLAPFRSARWVRDVVRRARRPSNHRHAAVDVQGLAGDVPGLAAG